MNKVDSLTDLSEFYGLTLNQWNGLLLALDLILTGLPADMQEALAYKLANRVVPDAYFAISGAAVALMVERLSSEQTLCVCGNG